MAARLRLLSRQYCHLCQDMADELRLMQTRFSFELEIIDVDVDAALEERYGEWVPVLLVGDREICHYRLDRSALENYLIECGSSCS